MDNEARDSKVGPDLLHHEGETNRCMGGDLPQMRHHLDPGVGVAGGQQGGLGRRQEATRGKVSLPGV